MLKESQKYPGDLNDFLSAINYSYSYLFELEFKNSGLLVLNWNFERRPKWTGGSNRFIVYLNFEFIIVVLYLMDNATS